MTRKHFKEIADALHNTMPDTDAAYSQWAEDVKAIADVCSMFNDNFDRQRFLFACAGGRFHRM